MSEQIDLAEGIKTRWAAVSALTALIPASRLVQTYQSGTSTLPYAKFTIIKDRDPDYFAPLGSGSQYLCYYRVRFEFWASSVDASLSAVMNAFQTGFNAEFTVPNSTMKSWVCVGPNSEIDEDQATKDAANVNTANLEYVAMLQRTTP